MLTVIIGLVNISHRLSLPMTSSQAEMYLNSIQFYTFTSWKPYTVFLSVIEIYNNICAVFARRHRCIDFFSDTELIEYQSINLDID